MKLNLIYLSVATLFAGPAFATEPGIPDQNIYVCHVLPDGINSVYGMNLKTSKITIDKTAKKFRMESTYSAAFGNTQATSIDGIVRVTSEGRGDNGNHGITFELLKENVKIVTSFSDKTKPTVETTDSFPQTLGQLYYLTQADGSIYGFFSEYDHSFLVFQHSVAADVSKVSCE